MHGRFRSLFITLVFVIFLCIASGPAYAQGDLDNDGIPDDVDPETRVTLNSVLSAGEYQFEDLIVTNGSILTLESNVTFEGYKGTLIHAANIRIDTGSVISADAKGYMDGPGAGEAYSGGGYGGRGGDAGGYLGGAAYGSALQPTDLGSGTIPTPSGSHGGGAIRLDVTDMLTADGIITANGDNYTGPGGSGGSIYLTAARFAGNGTLQANGCPSQYAGYYANYGGGGGGRIAVYYNSSTFTGTSEAKG
ncbi:MAG TPA: hypothetical protein PLN32_07230, partial [Methanoregulaceae archaeon]|nr:hypothetical protein [Methanoregulaceae archaeon]